MINKIFIVEDDKDISDIYKALMEKSGFEVTVFGLGGDIVKYVSSMTGETGEKKPDIVLLDLILPDMNGSDVLKEIKNNSETKDVKVFILTNQSDVKFEDSMKPDKIIIKANITPTQLVEVIKRELS